MNKTGFHIDFFGKRKIFFAISIAVMVIGLIFNFVFGVKLDLQFAGGAVIKYSVSGGDVSPDKVQDIIKDKMDKDADVFLNNVIGSGDTQVTVEFAGNQGITPAQLQELEDVLTADYADLSFKLVESSSVDAAMGSKFLQKCLVCLAITVVFLLIYIAFRFKKIGGLSAGISSIVALLHDVLFAYFFFVIFGLKINDIFIAVVLTILGYSLNDTIVIYDRIRENKKLMGPKADYGEVMNLSLNQTLTRTILTSVATFLALLVVYIVAAIYGLTSVTTFALPMMGGVISGCYSTLVIATPIYTMWQKRNQTKPKKAKA
jgi:protein-export membrane protein SecF